MFLAKKQTGRTNAQRKNIMVKRDITTKFISFTLRKVGIGL